MSDDIRAAFSRLSILDKALILARLAHGQTIHARDAYAHSYDEPDGFRLRDRNESVHRLTGFLLTVLGDRAGGGQHDFIAEAIERIALNAPTTRAQLEQWLSDMDATAPSQTRAPESR